MPDISMCSNEDCPVKNKCHRFTAIPSPVWQTYSDFTPEGSHGCNYFWDNTDYEKNEQVETKNDD